MPNLASVSFKSDTKNKSVIYLYNYSLKQMPQKSHKKDTPMCLSQTIPEILTSYWTLCFIVSSQKKNIKQEY